MTTDLTTEPATSPPTQAKPSLTNLLGMDIDQLKTFFSSMDEKSFRAQQLIKWIHQFGVTDFEQMDNLPKTLRAKLSEIACIEPPKVAHKEFSSDGTRKWVFDVGGSMVETVLIPAEDSKADGRKTLCISSQVGCALDCQFCSTGKQGFARDLTASEIIGQLWVANQSYMQHLPHTERTRTVTNVVMMGMGEPLLNFEPLVASLNLMLSDHAYGMSKRRVTVSTSGIVPKIYELSRRVDVALALSLHAPNDELRDWLVPINKKYPLSELMAAAHDYIDTNERSKKHVTIEYVMLGGVNDTNQHAHELVRLLEGLPCKVNLIPFNPFEFAEFERSPADRIEQFAKIISSDGIVCTTRKTRGDDIDAACGQLAGQVADRTRRAQNWKDKTRGKAPQKPRSNDIFHRS